MNPLRTKDGSDLPCIGMGTFPMQGERLAAAVECAYKCGYRLFDTADDYRGEDGIGMAIQRLTESGVKRESMFIQTKISDNHAYPDEPLMGVYFSRNSGFMSRHCVSEIVREKVATSLRKLNTSYLDSLLIHFPYPDYYVEIWREFVALRSEGVVRHIGVSNFSERHIEKLVAETGAAPEINELYLSPLGTKSARVDYCLARGIAVMGYSPLMDLVNERIPAEPVRSIARRLGKTDAQILLRWNIERGCMPLPKSSSPERLRENLGALDFHLDREDIAAISAMNVDHQYLVESNYCPGL